MIRRHNRPGAAKGPGIFAGLLFLALGVILLIGNFDWIEIRPTLTVWWPLILVLIGIKHFVLFRGASAVIGALFWIATGVLFLSSTSGYLNISVPGLLWPVMLIWFGVFTLLGDGYRCRRAVDDRSKP